MNLPFEPAVLQYLIVIITALAVSTAVGLKRGWRGQLLAFVPILAVWGLISVREDAIVAAVNTVYRGLLFLTACGTHTDSGSCLESSGVAAAVLVDPGNTDQTRLLLLAIFVITIVLVFTLVMRLGKPPSSLLQRLMGVVLGVANGFTLSYLLLPMLPYRQQIGLPIAAAAAEDDLPIIAQSLPISFNVPHVSVVAVVLVAFVVFVILAVRLMRPTEVQPP
jgi:hypothetical protein